MLGINLTFALLIILIFGLAGIPLGFWLRRRENLPLLDTLVIGYTLGWVLVPALFLLESLPGLLYSPPLIFINWALVALGGLALLWRDGALTASSISKSIHLPTFSSDPMPAMRAALPGAALVLLLLVTVLIRLGSAGSLIFELDPYFYLDGVRQVVVEGHNYFDDKTAWVSLGADNEISTHMGQPLYKYLLASWFSLYNGNAPYSPYTMADIGGLYPPISAALAVFFIYLFFREIYNERAGLLAGGLASFLPFFLLKQQAGDAQIVPYSIFAIFFFLPIFYMMLKRRSWIFTLLAAVAYGAIVLGSNIEILLVFCISLLFFGIGVRHILRPDEESRQLNRQLLVLLGLMTVVQIIFLAYASTHISIKEWLVDLVKNVGIPAVALLLPLSLDWLADMPERAKARASGTPHAHSGERPSTNHSGVSDHHLSGSAAPAIFSNFWRPISSIWQSSTESIEHALQPLLLPIARSICSLDRFWRAAFFVALLALVAILAPRLPGLDVLVSQYQFWGAYSEPLYRTIAEQAGGAPSFDNQFGFAALNLDPAAFAGTDLPSTLLHGLVQIFSTLNLLPTALLNAGYNLVASAMNILLFPDGGGNFVILDRVNSLATFFLFVGPLLLLLRWLWSMVDDAKAHWPLAPMLLLAFIIPITFMGFEKQKLLTYLGMALIMAAAATLGEFELLIRRLAGQKPVAEGVHTNHRSSHHAGSVGSPSVHGSDASAGSSSSPASASFTSSSPPFWAKWPLHPRYLLWALVVLLVLLEMGVPAIAPAWAAPLLTYSLTPTFQQAPEKVALKFADLCQATGEASICQAAENLNATRNNPVAFYDSYLCIRSLWTDPDPKHTPPPEFSLAGQFRCSAVSGYWIASMEWLNANMGNDTTVGSGNRVISWWDYGHWINFFGEHNTVLRNEHASREMIGRTAYAYLHSDVAELERTMKLYDSRYALMDVEIIGSGSSDSLQFGGKYGALNYLGCAYQNQTTVNTPLGSSDCETGHLWETIIVPSTPQNAQSCVISEATQQTGFIAYRLAYVRTPQGGLTQQPQPAYCIASGTLADGRSGILSYDLNKKEADGSMSLHPALWMGQANDGQYIYLTAVYDHQKLWPVNGTLVESWPYRTTKFYDSPLYQGFFLNQLPGYDLVYNSPQIRIYKMTDAVWNQKN
jgi:hypothetical protein